MSETLSIRPVTFEDGIAALTNLLHRAYRPLAERGMRYVALLGGNLAGTVTLYPTTVFSECAWYARPDIWYIGQYVVDPSYQGRGVGGALMDFAEEAARTGGAAHLALDTSEHAADLLAAYARHVETVQWPVTNYRSLVLSKTL